MEPSDPTKLRLVWTNSDPQSAEWSSMSSPSRQKSTQSPDWRIRSLIDKLRWLAKNDARALAVVEGVVDKLIAAHKLTDTRE